MSKQHVVLEENALKKKLKLHCQNFLLLLYYYKLNGQNQKEWAKLFQYFPFLLPLIGTNDIAWGNLYKIPVPYYYTRAQNVCPGWPVYGENALVAEGSNEGERKVTPTSISIFDSYDMKTF